MIQLTEFSVCNENEVFVESPICAIGETIINIDSISDDLKNKLRGLISSYYNQWIFVVDSYKELLNIFNELNGKSILSDNETGISDFDVFSVSKETEIRNYSYLLITSMKTLLDSFICIVDIIQNRVDREEWQMPDFFGYYAIWNGRVDRNISTRISDLESYLSEVRNNTLWLKNLRDFRNRIIHRGCFIRSDIRFSHIDNLNICLYRGNKHEIVIQSIDIGSLFSDFVVDIFKIEECIVERLLNGLDDLKELGITHKSSFLSKDGIRIYNSESLT